MHYICNVITQDDTLQLHYVLRNVASAATCARWCADQTLPLLPAPSYLFHGQQCPMLSDQQHFASPILSIVQTVNRCSLNSKQYKV